LVLLLPLDHLSATVAYTAATLGANASSFTATSNPGSLTGTGSSPITVSGLTSATNYIFTVTATNSNGTSAASSASNQITTDEAITVNYLVVAGGGGGGNDGGGGGAGGLRSTYTSTGGGGSLESAYIRNIKYFNKSYSCNCRWWRHWINAIDSEIGSNGIDSIFGIH
jgi:hypothetical protein